jgi:hypothetical protein
MTAPLLTPSHIVDEEHNVPGFLVHQHIEDLEHRIGQEF